LAKSKTSKNGFKTGLKDYIIGYLHKIFKHFKLQQPTYLCSAVFLTWLGFSITVTLCVIIGTIVYAFFHGCDPLSTGKIKAADQVIT